MESILPTTLDGMPARLIQVALLLLGGAIAGELASKFLRVPRIVGYVACGALIGPYALGIVDSATLTGLRLLVDVTLGITLFELGRRVDLFWLKRNPWLLAASLAEAFLSFALIAGFLWMLDFPPLLAFTAASIGVATGGAVIVAVTAEAGSQGQVTERLRLFAALNTVYAVVLLAGCFAALHMAQQSTWQSVFLHPLYMVAGSLAVAAIGALAIGITLRFLPRQSDALAPVLIGLMLLVIAFAHWLNLSVVLALLLLGVVARLIDRRHQLAGLHFGGLGALVLLMLFVLTGASLDFRSLGTTFVLVVAFIAARAAGKMLGVLAFSRASSLGVRKSYLLSLGLMPLSAVAVVLTLDTAKAFPQFGPTLGAVILAVIAVLELLGPLATHFAIKLSGEAKPEAAYGGTRL